MGREARRAQARAERRQRRQRQQPVRARAQQAALSGGTATESARGRGSIFKPRWATDIINELRRVTWPARGEVGYLTVVVIIVSLAMARSSDWPMSASAGSSSARSCDEWPMRLATIANDCDQPERAATRVAAVREECPS